MTKFSNDVDMLKYEPALFGELHLPWQVLAAGASGVLAGTVLTAGGADFVSAQVTAGCVAYLRNGDGSLDGAYEIVSVDSATELTVSVLRADSQAHAVAPPAATGIAYRISTFKPQAVEAAFALTEYFGIKPGNPASDYSAEDIMDTEALRRASVFAVVASVYAMLAGKHADQGFWDKSVHYQRMFEKARARCQLSIDAGSDGVADLTRVGASARLVRD